MNYNPPKRQKTSFRVISSSFSPSINKEKEIYKPMVEQLEKGYFVFLIKPSYHVKQNIDLKAEAARRCSAKKGVLKVVQA